MEKEKNYSRLDAILDFAIREEQKNQKLYADFAKKVESEKVKELLNKLSDMEKSHEERLRQFKDTGSDKYKGQDVSELRFEDFAGKDTVHESGSVKDFLSFAIDNEIKANELYMTVRDNYVGTDDRDLFEALANDELMHRHYLEKILKEQSR